MEGFILLTIEEYTRINLSVGFSIAAILVLVTTLLIFMAMISAKTAKLKRQWRFIYENKLSMKYDDWVEKQRKEWREKW